MAKKILRVVRGNEFTLSLSLLRRIIVTGGSRDEEYTPTSNLRLFMIKAGFEPYPNGGCGEGGCHDGACRTGDRDCDCVSVSRCGDQGCDYPLDFYYEEEDIPNNSPYPIPSPLAGCDPRVEIEITDYTVNNNVVTFNVPPTLRNGVYRFVISDTAPDGKALRAVLGDIFEITEVEIIEDSDDANAGVETGYDYVVYDLGSVTFLGQDAPTRAQFDALQQALADGLAGVNERIDEITVQAVQADWEENDPTSPSYIRNRTHYVRGREAEWTANVSLSGNYGTVIGVTGITIGKRYDVEVRVGNQLYSYTALLPKTDDEGHYYVSEQWDITASPQNPTGDDSFYIWNVDNTVYVGFSFLQNVSAEVTLYDSDVKRLDRQFMPDGVAWEVTQADIDEITGKI